MGWSRLLRLALAIAVMHSVQAGGPNYDAGVFFQSSVGPGVHSTIPTPSTQEQLHEFVKQARKLITPVEDTTLDEDVYHGRSLTQAAGPQCLPYVTTYKGAQVNGMLIMDVNGNGLPAGPTPCATIMDDTLLRTSGGGIVVYGFAEPDCTTQPGCFANPTNGYKCVPLPYLPTTRLDEVPCMAVNLNCPLANFKDLPTCMNAARADGKTCCISQWARCSGTVKYNTCAAAGAAGSCDATLGCELRDTSKVIGSYKWVARADMQLSGYISGELGISQVNINRKLSTNALFRDPDHTGDRAQFFFSRLEITTEVRCRTLCAQKAGCAGYMWTVPKNDTADVRCVLLPRGTRQYTVNSKITSARTAFYLLTEPYKQEDYSGKVVFKGALTTADASIWANANWARDVFFNFGTRYSFIDAYASWYMRYDALVNDVCATPVESPDACLAKCVANSRCQAWSTYRVVSNTSGGADESYWKFVYGWPSCTPKLTPGALQCALFAVALGNHEIAAVQDWGTGKTPVGCAAGTLINRIPQMLPPSTNSELDPIQPIRRGVFVVQAFPYEITFPTNTWSVTVSRGPHRPASRVTREMCELDCYNSRTCQAFNWVSMRKSDGLEIRACKLFFGLQAYTTETARYRSFIMRTSKDLADSLQILVIGYNWIWGTYTGYANEVAAGQWSLQPATGIYLPRERPASTPATGRRVLATDETNATDDLDVESDQVSTVELHENEEHQATSRRLATATPGSRRAQRIATYEQNSWTDNCRALGHDSWAQVLISPGACDPKAYAASYTDCRTRCRSTSKCAIWMWYRQITILDSSFSYGCSALAGTASNVCLMFSGPGSLGDTSMLCNPLGLYKPPGDVFIGSVVSRLSV